MKNHFARVIIFTALSGNLAVACPDLGVAIQVASPNSLGGKPLQNEVLNKMKMSVTAKAIRVGDYTFFWRQKDKKGEWCVKLNAEPTCNSIDAEWNLEVAGKKRNFKVEVDTPTLTVSDEKGTEVKFEYGFKAFQDEPKRAILNPISNSYKEFPNFEKRTILINHTMSVRVVEGSGPKARITGTLDLEKKEHFKMPQPRAANPKDYATLGLGDKFQGSGGECQTKVVKKEKKVAEAEELRPHDSFVRGEAKTPNESLSH